MGLSLEQERLIQKRIPDHVCARCRKPFNVGDRVMWAFILVDNNAHNPNRVTEKGLELGTDCEFVHSSCEDPTLSGKLAHRIL